MKTLILSILLFCSVSHAQVSFWPPGTCVVTAATAIARNLLALQNGCLVVQLDTSQVYEFNGSTFVLIGPGGGGIGLTSLNAQMGSTQVFANDTNVIVTSSNNTHTLGFLGTLSLARGGSGASLTGASGGVPYFSSTSAMAVLAAGTSGQILASGGSGAPTWVTPAVTGITTLNSQTGATQIFSNDTNITITSSNNTHALGWASTLSLARGGTGASLTAVSGGVAYSDSSALILLPAGTSGQFLQSAGSGAPTWASAITAAITSLNSQTQASQIFSNDANVTVTSSDGTHALGWASTLSVSRGGTSAALSPALGNIVYTDASKLVLLPAGTSGQVLTSNGGAAPSWVMPSVTVAITSLNAQTGSTQVFANDANITVSSSNNTHTFVWSGTLSLARGGSGASLTGADGGVPYFSSTSAMGVVAAGTSGQFLQSGGSGSPTWATAVTAAITSLNSQTGATQFFSNDPNITVTSSNNTHAMGFSGTLALSRGGTGANITSSAGGVAYGASTSAMAVTVAGTSGQFLRSAGAGTPTWASVVTAAITSLNSQTGATQVFANDTNVLVTSSNNTHTLSWGGTLSVARGGTSAALSPALGDIVYTDASSLVLLPAGTSGQFLRSSGAAAPTWATAITAAITSLNSQTGATQVFANDANITVTSSNNTHSLAWASTLSVARGGTGNSSFTSGSIIYSNGTNLTQDNADLFWDGTNKRLGIGTATPVQGVEINKSTFYLHNASSPFLFATGSAVSLGGNSTPIGGLDVRFSKTASSAVGSGTLFQQTITAAANNDTLNAVYINPTFNDNSKTGVTHNGLIVGSGNVGIGTTAPGATLHVVGHYKSTGTAPTVTVNANAGTGATCTIANATDMAGVVTLTTTAVSPSAGEQCKVNFNTAYGVAPICQLQPANAAGIVSSVVDGIYTTSSTTILSIVFNTADVAGQAFVFNYLCIETQ